MAKINVSSLQRPVARTSKVQLRDKSNPDVVLEMELKALDALSYHASVDLATRLIGTYMTGELNDDKAPLPLHFPGIELSENLIGTVSAIYVMQCGPEHEKYEPIELIQIAATMPSAWNRLGEVSTRLNKEGPLGNLLTEEKSIDQSSVHMLDTATLTSN